MANLIIKSSADDLVLKGSGGNSAITVAAAGTISGATIANTVTYASGGLTHPCFSQMYFTSDSTNDAVYSGFTIMDVGGYASPNEAITESGGTFSFTEVGYFKFHFCAVFQHSSADPNVQLIEVRHTSNNSSYTNIQVVWAGVDNSGGWTNANSVFWTRVTDVANQKIQVHRSGLGGVGTCKGGNNPVYTWVAAEKIATN